MAAGRLAALLGVVVLVAVLSQATAHCPNFCSGHGDCIPVNKCVCWSRWEGGDCSMRKCQESLAWADEATATDTAHNIARCSNRGICDSATGICKCQEGFEGLACQRMSCSNDCSSHGTCRSMKYHARTRSQGESHEDVDVVLTYNNNWDAEKIYGCECDPDYDGHDCALRLCPKGDDPMTTAQANERQLFKCLEDPSDTSGTFTLSFRGETTEPIHYYDTAQRVEDLLEALITVRGVEVRFHGTPITVCSNTVENPVSIEFTDEFGALPHVLSKDPSTQVHPRPNMVFAYDGEEIGGQLSVAGEKESLPCSGRGFCDQKTGICHCYTGYVTSNGQGEEGHRGDCGYAELAITSCPGTTECSGHGVCSDHPYYKCTCAAGWTGGDCSERTCPFGNAWFDFPFDPVSPPDENDRAHGEAECSNKGFCNRETGECQCDKFFEGAACERMSCPVVNGETCSAHGRCLNMFQLAQVAEDNGDATDFTYGHTPNDPQAWDYNKVYGCKCDEGYEGYDCSLRSCPTGDDVTTTLQNKERQVVKCTGTTGSFKLKFRQYTTTALTPSSTVADVEAALELLVSIEDVTVVNQISEGSGICDATGAVWYVNFETELGDLPPMTVEDEDTVTVSIATDGTLIDGIESRLGDVENSVCSERGLCNHKTGQCECFLGFSSSDSSGGKGGRGDCGYRMPVVPVVKEGDKKLFNPNTLEPFDIFQ